MYSYSPGFNSTKVLFLGQITFQEDGFEFEIAYGKYYRFCYMVLGLESLYLCNLLGRIGQT
jgi:hypothetical protein